MAFQCSAFLVPLVLSFFVLSWSSLATHSPSALTTMHAPHALVIVICKKTMNPEFCKTSLFNYPRTKYADMNELGIVSILLATDQGRINKLLVDQLLSSNNDPVVKNSLAYCLRDYAVILNKLKKAYVLSEKKDYKEMLKLVNDAMKMTNKCEDEFKKRGRPSLLTDYNMKMVWLNDITLVILDVLDG